MMQIDDRLERRALLAIIERPPRGVVEVPTPRRLRDRKQRRPRACALRTCAAPVGTGGTCTGRTRRTRRTQSKQVFPPPFARKRIAFEIEKQIPLARLGQSAQPLLDARRQQRHERRPLRLPTQSPAVAPDPATARMPRLDPRDGLNVSGTGICASSLSVMIP